jgi:hypothetical protein
MSEINDFGKGKVMKQKDTGNRPIEARGARDLLESLVEDGEDSAKENARVQYSASGPNTWMGAGKTIKTLSSGMYDIDTYKGEPIFEKKDINVDSYLLFPDSKSEKILNEINDFWNRGEVFKEFGFLHRRGVLLYGSPGGGKTVIVQQIIKQVIDRKGIVFLCSNPEAFSAGIHAFREIEPHRPVVCIFEDLDSIVEHYGEDSILSILDGEDQIDKVLNIATTNYPEKLDKRLVARPRRFDRVIKIGMPDENVRRLYFNKKLNIKEDELETWVKSTNDFSFAAMAELVISVKCLGNDFNKSVETLKKMMVQKISSSESEGGSVGFGG